MTLLHKQINFIFIVTSVSIGLSLVACTEKVEDTEKTVVNDHAVKTVTTTATDGNIAQLQREAQEGDPDAQYNLAYIYENGLGVPKDEAKALELYQNAADQGHSGAQNNLNALKGH